MNKSFDSDILIAGGGVIGMAFALSLSKIGFKEPFSIKLISNIKLPVNNSKKRDGRAYNLSAASVRFLQALGVWDELSEFAQPMRNIEVYHKHPAHGGVKIEFDNLDKTVFGHGEVASYIVRSDDLEFYLAKMLQKIDNVEVVAPVNILSSECDNNCVKLYTDKKKQPFNTRLLAIADGRQSNLRAQNHFKTLDWSSEQISIVFDVEHEHEHNGHAWQYFLKDGPFAILPLNDQHLSSIVWTETTASANQLLDLSKSDFAKELQKRFAYHLGRVKPKGEIFSYPLNMVLAHEFVKPRMALIGDAAHGIHPLAGQGVNLGFKDCACLSQSLMEGAKLGFDIADYNYLLAYEKWRRFDSTAFVMGCDAINRIMGNRHFLMRGINGSSFSMIDKMPSLKQFFINEAAGSIGKMPELMRG